MVNVFIEQLDLMNVLNIILLKIHVWNVKKDILLHQVELNVLLIHKVY